MIDRIVMAFLGVILLIAVVVLAVAGYFIVADHGTEMRIKQQEADAMTEAARSGRLVVTAPRDSK